MMLRLSLLLVAGCGTTSPRVPANLDFYVGAWTCDGTAYDAAGKPTERMTLGIRVAPALDNWLAVAVFQDGVQLTAELKGYDPTGHAFHHLWASRDGSSGSLTAAAGWQGDQIVFDEDHPDPSGKTRMTFRRIDATHFEHRADVDEGHGFHPSFTKQCHKT